MFGVLDPAVHVNAAAFAGVALNGSSGIDDRELVRVFGHRQLIARDDRHDREQCARRLPTLGAAAGVIVGGLRVDRDFDRILRAFAEQSTAGKILGCGLDAVIHRRMN